MGQTLNPGEEDWVGSANDCDTVMVILLHMTFQMLDYIVHDFSRTWHQLQFKTKHDHLLFIHY